MQMALEGAKQKPDETTAAYIRRFVIDADRTYPTTRSASDEVRVVSSILKGLTDRKLAGQVCDEDEVDTLADSSKVALAKEAKREKREQMIGHDDGHEPMELGSAHQDKDAADKFLSSMDTMQRRMEQMQTRLQQAESRLTETPPASPPPQHPQSTQPDRTRHLNWRPALRDRRNTRSHQRQAPARPRWTDQGEPPCLRCNCCSQPTRTQSRQQNSPTAPGGR